MSTIFHTLQNILAIVSTKSRYIIFLNIFFRNIKSKFPSLFGNFQKKTDLNPVQNGGIENIHPRIDLIGHEFLWFFDEALNHSVLGADDDAIFRRLLHPRHDDGALLPVPLVELDHLLERKLARDVGIQYEKGFRIGGQDLPGER